MSLSAGTRVGPYEITGLLGSGGMSASSVILELVEGPTLAERLQGVASGRYVAPGTASATRQ